MDTTKTVGAETYQLLNKLGEGGNGVVFRAFDKRLKRIVAIKFLHKGIDEKARKNFLREARMLASLSHPNIVGIHEISEIDNRLCIIMEFVAGVNLRRLLFDKKRLDEEEAVRYALQIIDGLSQAHERGIVHRDIKPENIIVDLEGQVKIVDFGTCRLFEDSERLTRTGFIAGTRGYIAPERYFGKTTLKSDIWSLGVVLYEMLTGAMPGEASSGEVSGKLAGVLRTALQDEPERRFKSIRKFGEALKLFKDNSSEMGSESCESKEMKQPFRIIDVVLVVAVCLLAYTAYIQSQALQAIGAWKIATEKEKQEIVLRLEKLDMTLMATNKALERFEKIGTPP